uniref:NADH dehydrogenase subunit 6 n=1 Tax=Libellula quadrimaculata TaxID=70395 RepID=UPI001EDD518F|nr:NADH dehydrogenase subunit 6 [Libellula quadrimaculata]UIB40237.1 NADH dehydrogenase subunit 6 [Libellula quadrimaculata]
MSQILSVIFMISNSLMFSYMLHPMNMGIILLMQTIMMSILMGLMSYTSWFSYILFLVFLGGMLVLFIYMTSIASNEIFMSHSFITSIITIMVILMISLLMLMDPFMTILPVSEQFMDNTNSPNLIMTPLYNNPFSSITVFMVLYLFLTLIVIVSLTKFNKGPLRPMN